MAKKIAPVPNLHALLMAADCYLENRLPDGSYPSLTGCVRDVAHVEAFLLNSLKVPPERITKLTSTNTGATKPPEPREAWPTYENILKAFKALARRAKKGDQVYLHYSGHGGRCATAYPDLKGKDGLDESLVPIDIGSSSARYVRDLEMAALLKQLTDQGLVVTLVLDCCHSGGATRGIINNVAVRGVEFIDSTVRPPGEVTIPEELKTAWNGRSATRALTVSSGFLIEPKGYTLLAACRPSELAYEFAFQGAEKNGALTYWMLEAFDALGPNTTYKDVYDRILAGVHGQFEMQTPMLEGEADRVVFGVNTVPVRPTAVVIQVKDPTTIVIGGGQATGLRDGAQLAIYDRGEVDVTSPKKRKAVVEVKEPGATDSTAIVLPPAPRRKIAPGDQAVLLGAGSSKLVRGVRLIKPDGKPATSRDAALQAVAKAMLGNGWVEIVSGADPAEFLVTLNEAGTEYELCDRAGEPIANLRPAIRVKDPGAADAVVQRLVHLAKYRAVQDLDNFDRSSPLRGKLVAEIVGFQVDYDPVDKPDPKPFADPRQIPKLRIGETAFLKITNKSTQVLNIVVLDLEPNWGISQVFPGGQNLFFEPLDPGRSLDLVPLTANLPEGYPSGTDIIKVFATVGSPNFQVLKLPPLDEPSQGRVSQGTTRGLGGPNDPLDALLASVAADQPPTRSLTSHSSPSSEWVVTQLEFRITRTLAQAERPKAKTGQPRVKVAQTKQPTSKKR